MGSHAMPTGPAGAAQRRRRRQERRAEMSRRWGWVLGQMAWFFEGIAAIRDGVASHATVGYYVVSAACWLAIPVVALLGALAWGKTARARPRWHYGAAALTFGLVCAAGLAVAAGLRDQLPAWWPTGPEVQALAPPAAFLVVGAAVAAVALAIRALKPPRTSGLSS
jgi:hypothetical protein